MEPDCDRTVTRSGGADVASVGRAEAAKVEAAKVEALGLAEAEGYRAQREAIGELATALVAVAKAVSEGQVKVVPDVLVTGGSGGGALDGLAASVMRMLRSGTVPGSPALPTAEDPEAA